jgi:hypothetical protein
VLCVYIVQHFYIGRLEQTLKPKTYHFLQFPSTHSTINAQSDPFWLAQALEFFLRFVPLPCHRVGVPLFTFNLLSLYQHQVTPGQPYRNPRTLRVAVFLCGAVLGVMGRDVVVKQSAAWGGWRKNKPLVDATLDWLNFASPKLVPPEDRLPIGGDMI